MRWNAGTVDKKAVVLSGSPGIGKTSAALALANEMGWAPVEMNASDQRTGDVIKRIAVEGSHYDTFSDDGEFLSASEGRRKLIILDEADSLYGNSDRGAGPAIGDLVRSASQPVILIANDLYALNRKSSAIKDGTLQIAFRKPTLASVAKAIRTVASEEGVSVSEDAALKIADGASGDMRAAIRDLQALSMSRKEISLEDTAALGGREARSEMFDVVGAIYRRRDPALAREKYFQADTDPDSLLLWLSENMPYEVGSSGDLVRVAEKLSRADVYLGRVSKRMSYGFRSYALDMMIHGVPDAMKNSPVSHDRIRFPSYLMRMSRSKSVRALRKSTAAKVAAATHTSSSRVLNDVLPQLRTMLKNDAELRRSFTKEADLLPEELAYILDVEPDRKIVKDVFAEPKPEKVPKTRKTRKAKEPEPLPEAEPVPEEPKKAPANTRSLFDFGA